MRFLFLLILVANAILLVYGQGYLGAPPNEQGREPRQLLRESHQQDITIGPALETRQVAR